MERKAIKPIYRTQWKALAVGATAYAVFSRVTAQHRVDQQYLQIREAASKMSATSENPVKMAVIGFEKHGRSSFINTLFRVLYKEEGPLIVRALSSPPNSNINNANKNTAIVHDVKNRLVRYPKYLLRIIECPSSPSNKPVDTTSLMDALTDAECAVVVAKADECTDDGPAWERLPQLIEPIRQQGLQFVVVLTHRKEAKKAKLKLRELARDVAQRAGTDFVHCVENYVVGDGNLNVVATTTGKVNAVHNDLDIHSQILTIVLQCMEFARQRRLSVEN